MQEENVEASRVDSVVLALLFASDEPLSLKRLSAIVSDVSLEALKASVANLKERLARDYPSIILEQVAGGLQLSTNPEYANYVAQLYAGKRKQRLSRAGMETLAIIAYKQPTTRADIENVRGVSCGGVLTTLMERNLIRIAGKAKVLGAPFLYGTTPEFLEYLGVDRLKDLPSVDELEAMLEHEESARAEDEEHNGDVPAGASTLETFTLGNDDSSEVTETTADAPPGAAANVTDATPRTDNPD